MKKICIIASYLYPIPAVKGGAVEGLVEILVRENEVSQKMDLTVVSVYDAEAEKESKKYKHTQFYYVSYNALIDMFFSKKIFIYINKLGIKFWSKTFVSMPFAKNIWKQIKNESYDRYILEGGGNNYNFGYLAKKLPTSKFYVHVHGEFPGDNAFAKWFGKCIAVSNFIARRLICNGIVDSFKVKVLPNCFDPAVKEGKWVNSEQIRAMYGLSESDFVYVYWGRLIPQKGVYELLLAFSKVSKSIPNARLLVMGNATFGISTFGTYDKKLESICASNALNERVIFTGFVPHEKMGEILSACDVGVIPSIWDDPAPLTVFEGLATGLPLIASRTGGIPEIIQNGLNGLLADWNENFSDTLADKMELMYNDSELRRKLSAAASKTMDRYTSKVFYDKFVESVD